MRVAVVCVTSDSSAVLDGFAAALPQGLAGCRSRVVFVDSGSQDDSRERAQALVPDADLVDLGGNRGFAAGLNAGIAHVRRTGGADVHVVVNPDVRLAPGCVRRLADALDSEPAGLAAPRLVDEHGRLLFSLRCAPTAVRTCAEAVLGGRVTARLGLPGIVLRDAAAYDQPRSADWATGGLLAVSDRCAREVGPWDESFFLYEEEVEFCLRAAALGHRLRYVPSAGATRVVGRPRPTPEAHALMRVNRWRRLARRSPRAAAAARSAMLLGDGLRALGGRADARAGVWALWHRATPEQVVRRHRTAGMSVPSPVAAPGAGP